MKASLHCCSMCTVNMCRCLNALSCMRTFIAAVLPFVLYHTSKIVPPEDTSTLAGHVVQLRACEKHSGLVLRLGWAVTLMRGMQQHFLACAVDMLEEPVSGDEGEDAAAHKKGKKKRRRNQQ